MKTYNIQLNKKQIFSLISQLNEKEKIDLLKKLQKSTWLIRFENLLKTLRTDELSNEEITDIVEEVRQKRFNEGKHND